MPKCRILVGLLLPLLGLACCEARRPGPQYDAAPPSEESDAATIPSGEPPDQGMGGDAAAGPHDLSVAADLGAVADLPLSAVDAGPPPACQRDNVAALPHLAVQAQGKLLPYCTSLRLESHDPLVTQAVVVVHGNARDVDHYFDSVTSALKAVPTAPATVVVAPYFQATDGCGQKSDAPDVNDLRWSCSEGHSWKDGEEALNEATSSFTALDALLDGLHASFPALQRITVTGFSAGGQLIQRYAAASRKAKREGLLLRFVIGDPSSFLYLDETRLIPGQSCSDRDHCPLSAASFQKPYAGAQSCPGYDAYKYGLGSGLPSYLNGVTAVEIRDRYVARDITYLVAALDNAATRAADYSVLDVDCAAEAQGPLEEGTDPKGAPVRHSYRMQRALTYWHYLTDVLHASHKLLWVAGCGHDSACVYADSGARDLLFVP